MKIPQNCCGAMMLTKERIILHKQVNNGLRGRFNQVYINQELINAIQKSNVVQEK